MTCFQKSKINGKIFIHFKTIKYTDQAFFPLMHFSSSLKEDIYSWEEMIQQNIHSLKVVQVL